MVVTSTAGHDADPKVSASPARSELVRLGVPPRRHGRGYPSPPWVPPLPVEPPVAQASPAELREAIVPEDRESFDEQYRQALDAAAETFTLDALERFPVHWRRIAWSQTDMGHQKWRAMLARAEETLRTGESPPGAVSADEMRLRLRAAWLEPDRCTRSASTNRRRPRHRGKTQHFVKASCSAAAADEPCPPVTQAGSPTTSALAPGPTT